MREILPATVNVPAGQQAFSYATIAANKSDTPGTPPTPTVIKVKHIKAVFDCNAGSVALNNGFVCVLYVPEGITITANSPIAHPEWIMAWRGFELTYQTNNVLGNQVQLNSNLSRNLNSGDSIILFCSIQNPTEVGHNFFWHTRFSCVVRNN